MKVFMINPNNERFEAEIVRYFQNINDKYIIYTLGEKDASGFQIVYATKIVNDGGVRVGKTITDENEWVLVKNFIKETVNQNKNNQPLTIQDVNPAEILELKIDSVRPFKLQAAVVEMFAKNQKTFEIVQNVAKVETPKVEQEQVVVPEAQPITKPVQPMVSPVVEPKKEEVPVVQPIPQFEMPEVQPISPVISAVQPAQTPTVEVPKEEPKVENPVVAEMPAPVEVAPVEAPVVGTENVNIAPNTSDNSNYKELYEQEAAKNKDLSAQLEALMHDYVTLKVKMDQVKELLG